VHCAAGVSRSGAAAAAYLMHRNRATRDDTLAEIRRARCVVRPNDGFLVQLAQWQARLLERDMASLRVAPNQVAGHSSKGVGQGLTPVHLSAQL